MASLSKLFSNWEPDPDLNANKYRIQSEYPINAYISYVYRKLLYFETHKLPTKRIRDT